jgi:hypothetical protein
LVIQSHDKTIQIQNGLEKTDKQTVLSKLKYYSQSYGVPSWIVSSIVEVESNFQTHLAGDGGKSFGLLQTYTNGGQGDGYSGRYLSNVDNNLKIGMPHLKKGYDEGIKRGKTGYDLLEYTASHSGHPSHNGTWTTGYRESLKRSFKNGDELSGINYSSSNTEYQKADIGTWIIGDTQNVSKELLGRLAFMGKTYNEKVSITSGFRSQAKQQILYDLYKAGKGNLAAKPGTSKHEKGLAVDIGNPKLQAKSDDIFKSFGLHRPVFSPQRELWHIELWNEAGSGGGFSSGEIREKIQNGFDNMGFEELTQGSYSVFSSLDKMSRTTKFSDTPSVSNGFGIPEFINGSGKAIAFRSVVVLIGIIIIFAVAFKNTNLGRMI